MAPYLISLIERLDRNGSHEQSLEITLALGCLFIECAGATATLTRSQVPSLLQGQLDNQEEAATMTDIV